MNEYDVTIRWSVEDGVYVAEAPDLPGCMAHGSTQEEALANLRDAMALWMEVARLAGDPVPPPTVRTTGR